jgi:hypothetical protein
VRAIADRIAQDALDLQVPSGEWLEFGSGVISGLAGVVTPAEITP